jgi:hypothetical protein
MWVQIGCEGLSNFHSASFGYLTVSTDAFQLCRFVVSNDRTELND